MADNLTLERYRGPVSVVTSLFYPHLLSPKFGSEVEVPAGISTHMQDLAAEVDELLPEGSLVPREDRQLEARVLIDMEPPCCTIVSKLDETKLALREIGLLGDVTLKAYGEK